MMRKKIAFLKVLCTLLLFSFLSSFLLCYGITSLDSECKRHVLKINRPYSVKGKTYYPRYQPGYREIGLASWYGNGFYGNKTASGEIYRGDELTAAHKTLPLHSIVKVTNITNNKHVIVRINDRGPFAEERNIDLSRKAAEKLGITEEGLAKVRVNYIGMSYKNIESYCSKNEISDVLRKREIIKKKQEFSSEEEEYSSNSKAMSSIYLNDLDYNVRESQGIYYVQIGAYKNKINAEHRLHRFILQEEIDSRDLSIVYVKPFYKVHVGPYDLLEARNLVNSISSNDYFIVRKE